jgi:hypothetical protein
MLSGVLNEALQSVETTFKLRRGRERRGLWREQRRERKRESRGKRESREGKEAFRLLSRLFVST